MEKSFRERLMIILILLFIIFTVSDANRAFFTTSRASQTQTVEYGGTSLKRSKAEIQHQQATSLLLISVCASAITLLVFIVHRNRFS